MSSCRFHWHWEVDRCSSSVWCQVTCSVPYCFFSAHDYFSRACHFVGSALSCWGKFIMLDCINASQVNLITGVADWHCRFLTILFIFLMKIFRVAFRVLPPYICQRPRWHGRWYFKQSGYFGLEILFFLFVPEFQGCLLVVSFVVLLVILLLLEFFLGFSNILGLNLFQNKS